MVMDQAAKHILIWLDYLPFRKEMFAITLVSESAGAGWALIARLAVFIMGLILLVVIICVLGTKLVVMS